MDETTMPELTPEQQEAQDRKTKQKEDLKWNLTNHKPTEMGIAIIEANRAGFKQLATRIIDGTQPSREQALALTKLEEALMWANAAVARYETEDERE